MNCYAPIALLADNIVGSDSSIWIAAGFILLALAVVLGLLELFVPTGGVLAVATASCLVASIIAFFMHGMLWGFAALLAYSAGAPFAVVFGFKLWTRTPIARRMVLGSTDGDIEGQEPVKAMPGPVAVGTAGVALTPLRPIGFVRFGDLRLEAAAEMGMIDIGAAVTVVESTGDRVVVRTRG
jgi:membrane-bound serine protease (ClpP class)